MSDSFDRLTLKRQLHDMEQQSNHETTVEIAREAREAIVRMEMRLAIMEDAARHLAKHSEDPTVTDPLEKALSQSQCVERDSQTHHCPVSLLWLTGLGEAYRSLLSTTPVEHQDPDHIAMIEQLEDYLGEPARDDSQWDQQALINSPWKAVAKEMADHLERLTSTPPSHTGENHARCHQLIRHVRLDAPQLSYHHCTHNINLQALSPTIGRARRSRLAAQVATVADTMKATGDTDSKAYADTLTSILDMADTLVLHRARVAHCLYTGDKASLVLSLDANDAERLMSNPDLHWVWLSQHHEDQLKI